MSTTHPRALPVAAAALLSAVLGLTACAGPAAPPVAGPAAPANPTAASSPAPVPGTGPSPTSAPVPTPDVIVIQDFAFEPAAATVAAGSRITVQNRDAANHTLVALDGSFDTGNIPGNATGTFVAPSRPGTYPYRCSIHPVMTGMLTVR